MQALRISPVSYTHLDVYKRQGSGRAAFLKNNTDQPIAAFVDNPLDGFPHLIARIHRHPVELVAVSYTHLRANLSRNLSPKFCNVPFVSINDCLREE